MKLFRKLMPFLVGYDILEEFGFVAPNAFQRNLCSFTSSMGYVVYLSCTILMGGFLAFEAETFDEISEHFYEFATGVSETFYYVYVNLMCKQFFEMNDDYERIIKKRSINGEQQKIYEKARKLVEMSSKYIYIGYVKIVFPFLTVPYLLTSYFNYFTTNLGKDSFSLPFVVWSIFDWRTPWTYIFAFTIQFLFTAYATINDSVLLMHSFASVWLFIAFVDDIRIAMSSIDTFNRNKTSDAKLYEYLCEFIKFHTEIKQLLAKFSNTYALIFQLNLLWTASSMVVVLLSLQMDLTRPEIDLPAILKDIVLTFATIVALLVICSVCEELKGRIDDLNIYLQCNWYQYPSKMRRILAIIIMDSQNSELLFKVVGSITASRDTCKKVINGGFLTIMVLRTCSK